MSKTKSWLLSTLTKSWSKQFIKCSWNVKTTYMQTQLKVSDTKLSLKKNVQDPTMSKVFTIFLKNQNHIINAHGYIILIVKSIILVRLV